MGTLPYPNPTNSAQWSKDLLTELGDPLTPTNVGYIEAWIAHESPSGFGYNPLGTEQTTPTSIHAPGNSASVQAFRSWADGLSATLETFAGNAGNLNLLIDLKKGNASYAQLAADQTQGSWKTGGEKTITGPGTLAALHLRRQLRPRLRRPGRRERRRRRHRARQASPSRPNPRTL